MIAAVLGPGSAQRAEIVQRLVASAGFAPAEREFVRGAELLSWKIEPLGRIVGSECGVVGQPHGLLVATEEGIQKLRGDFAVVAPADDSLILGRGPFAGRPMFFACCPRLESVVACSRLEPLVAALPFRPTLDAVRLAVSTAALYASHLEKTPYREISRLALGQTVRVHANGRVDLHVRSYVTSFAREAPEDLAEELRERLFNAVRRAVGSAGRVAVLTGGGVDSGCLLALVAAVARGARPQEVEAIALDFAGPGDDRPYLRSLCDDLGLVPVRVKPRDFGAGMRRSLVLDAAPATWETAAWDIGLARLARERGCHLVLTGAGGDDVLGGDPAALVEQAPRLGLFRTLAAAHRLRVPWKTTSAGRMQNFVLRPLIRRKAPRLVRTLRSLRRASWPSWAGPHMRELVREDGTSGEASLPSWLDTEGGAVQPLLSAKAMVDVLDNLAQVEKEAQCTLVHPYLDDELVEFMTRIPPPLLLHDDRLRGLFRLALRGLVPEDLRTRTTKADFEPAVAELVQGAGGFEVFRDLASMTELADLGLVNPPAYGRCFERLAANADSSREWITTWAPLAVEAFLRAYRAGAIGAAASSTQEVPAGTV